MKIHFQETRFLFFPFPLFYLQSVYKRAAILFCTMSAPKSPHIDLAFYEQPKTISYFDSIINTLRVDLDKEGADTSFSSPDLSYFTAHFQQFQLTHLGKEAADKAKRHRKTIGTGVPFGLFNIYDLSPNSSLYTILKAAYKFKSDNQIEDWRFEAKEEVPTYLQMVQVIKEALIDFAAIPKVCLTESIDDHRKKKLSLLIEGLGGKKKKKDNPLWNDGLINSPPP